MVHCALCIVYCLLCLVNCPLYTVYCVMYTVYCVMYDVYCALHLHPVYRTLGMMKCAISILKGTLRIVQCVLCIVPCVKSAVGIWRSVQYSTLYCILEYSVSTVQCVCRGQCQYITLQWTALKSTIWAEYSGYVEVRPGLRHYCKSHSHCTTVHCTGCQCSALHWTVFGVVHCSEL